MKGNRQLKTSVLLLGMVVLVTAGCHKHAHQDLDITESAEPDKILYDKALEDIGNHRFEVARLTLQTLINTYPESVYLADAKLAVADSYYEEGTTSALAHAEIEFKDYITFFPNSPEAPRAQYLAAMTHYRQLELADRDQTHARRAEVEFQNLLKMFPNSEYAEEGVNKLLQVQELLAEGEYLVGRFYFVRKLVRPSAVPRLEELVERYPNFSKRDEALWMLANAWGMPNKEIGWEPDQASLDNSSDYLLRIVREHPTSERFDQARRRLETMGVPVPEPDPLILERAQTVKTVGEKSERPGLLKRMFGRLSGRPDTSAAAARLGPPPLEPPDDMSDLPFRQMRRQREAGGTIKINSAEAGSQ